MKSTASYFHASFATSLAGLILAFAYGWSNDGHWAGAGAAALICLILGLLEVSLSFDNSLINATIIKRMTPLWRHRFLTWGMLIAVFGMRLVFPIAIVGVIAWINPWDA